MGRIKVSNQKLFDDSSEFFHTKFQVFGKKIAFLSMIRELLSWLNVVDATFH